MTNQEFLFDLATHENSNTEQTLHNTLVAATLQLDMNHGFISSLQENHTVLYSYPHHYQGSVITQLAEPLEGRVPTGRPGPIVQ